MLSTQTENPITVSQYFSLVNDRLKSLGRKRVIGEITKAEIRTHCFFSLKDKDGSVLNCVIWESNYRLCGVEMKEGQEVVVYGESDVYAPSGRFTFKASTVELNGEGQLKIAFEKLRKQLETEGLFAFAKKKPLPPFPRKIGLITSKTGDAIVDFRTNLGRFGFQTTFLDSRVEGQLAVQQLLASIRTFREKDIDVLVLVRGGGSLESLQAYNNEMIVRELSTFPKPILTGIGHEKDVTLVDLVADRRESTPTGAAKALNVTWELLINKIRQNREFIRNQFEVRLQMNKRNLSRSFHIIKSEFKKLIDDYNRSKERVRDYLAETLYQIKTWRGGMKGDWSIIRVRIKSDIKEARIGIKNGWSIFGIKIKASVREGQKYLEHTTEQLSLRNPLNQLKFGYSILRSGNKVLKGVDSVNIGDVVNIQVSDGEIETKVQKIK